MENYNDYLSQLELADAPLLMDSEFFESLNSEKSDHSEAGFVAYKGLQSFAAGVSVQNREDVLNSLLLAQRAASKSFPNEKDIFKWYGKYFEVLENVGWVLEGKDFSKFASSHNKFDVHKALLEILGAAVTAGQLAIVMKTLSALKDMADHDGRITFFERNTHTSHKGSFQLGVADEVNGTVSLSANAFILSTETTITKILFFTSARNEAELNYCLAKATLNSNVYATYREQIIAKLTDNSQYIADLDI